MNERYLVAFEVGISRSAAKQIEKSGYFCHNGKTRHAEVMVITPLIDFQELPCKNASQVKNKWAEVVRFVREEGSVAVTSHSAVEIVMLDVNTYRQLTEEIQVLKAREQTGLDELENRFNARLASLQQPEARANVQALFNARGKAGKRPKAGSSY
jgi:prevent-host-death family protein